MLILLFSIRFGTNMKVIVRREKLSKTVRTDNKTLRVFKDDGRSDRSENN